MWLSIFFYRLNKLSPKLVFLTLHVHTNCLCSISHWVVIYRLCRVLGWVQMDSCDPITSVTSHCVSASRSHRTQYTRTALLFLFINSEQTSCIPQLFVQRAGLSTAHGMCLWRMILLIFGVVIRFLHECIELMVCSLL